MLYTQSPLQSCGGVSPLGWCDGCHRTTAPVRSPHTSYSWRGERIIEPIKWIISLYYRQWYLKPHIPDQESHCEKRGDKQSHEEKVTEAGLQKTWHCCQSDTFSAGQSPKQTDFSLYSTQALSSQSSTSLKLSVTYIVPLLQCRKQGFRVGDNLIRDALVL